MSWTEEIAAVIEKHFGSTQRDAEPTVEVTKALDEEQRMALFIVLEPQDGDETTDLHGDTYSAEEVWKACNNFSTHCMKSNLFHRVETQKAKIVQSFVTLAGFTLEDGREITKGSWLQWWHFPKGDEESEVLWKMVKEGTINGVSIGAMSKVADV